ncbi:2-amino-4-hydroxy-6-hydroxymethyldihydropteridine diphosphokinase [Aestuariivirga sp.]|uniref:2-amino-4-hydroxy-6- hydroxymethyldihydropteridine diphosphokinase n=1 Tax=Aestuariivirga sp. TaxID=2650926 RepID=UPI003018B368
MILVALGSNSNGPWGTPRETVAEALRRLNSGGMRLRKASQLLVTAPFGVTDQPDFVNAVAEVETQLPPETLLKKLHMVERLAGRRRTLRWGPRTLDLDLIDYHGLIRRAPPPVLPHPGIAERIFVLAPIAEIAPQWRHPETKLTAAALLRKLDHDGEGRLL